MISQTIGNHEFDNKVEGVVPFLKYAKAPVVVTNIDDSEEPTLQVCKNLIYLRNELFNHAVIIIYSIMERGRINI